MTTSEIQKELIRLGVPAWGVDVEDGGVYVSADLLEIAAQPSAKIKALRKSHFDKGTLFLASA
jgi:hypothetical protein